MKKACIFDLDGTLVDSIIDLGNAMNTVLENHYLPTHSIDDYRQFVGNGVKKLVQRALGEHQDIYQECLKEFYDIYTENCLHMTIPYPGIIELLHVLKSHHIQMSVVTNKPHSLAVKIVEHYFPDIFTSIYGQQDLYPIKPNPQSTMFALMSMHCQKEECIFIGDSDVDIETGENVGMETIGVIWGFRGYEELKKAGATYIVDNCQDIKELIIQ